LIQVGLHGFTAIGLYALYWPKKRTDYPGMSFKQWTWACDPIGCLFHIISATSLLLSLSWAGGAYKWSSPHVFVGLIIGIAFLIAFGVYGKSHQSQ
jgi:hypothetical protein